MHQHGDLSSPSNTILESTAADVVQVKQNGYSPWAQGKGDKASLIAQIMRTHSTQHKQHSPVCTVKSLEMSLIDMSAAQHVPVLHST